MLKNAPKLRTESVRDIIYEHIRKAIVLGELKAETFFTDGELADDFGVSRTPVREAIQKLEAQGYIERVPMKGSRVRSLSPYELAHTFAVRKAIEVLAVRYGAIRATDEDLSGMQSLLVKIDAAAASLKGDEFLDKLFPLVRKYNNVMFDSAKSARLTELIRAQRDIIDRYLVMRLVLPFRVEKSIARRREVFEAYKSHDPDRAASVWTEHLNESFMIWKEKAGYSKELEDFQLL